MKVDDPASARAEAERLVAAALAAFSSGHGLFGGGPVATGEPACCVCPICRVIAAMRDPDADVAERLATGAGDFAAGVASLLRSVAPPPPPAPSDSPEDDVWRAATRAE